MSAESELTRAGRKDTSLRTVVGRGTTIEGKVHIQSSGRVDGTIIGELVVSNTVVIGEEGVVEGDVVSEVVIIGGRVKGTVYATERAVLETNSTLIGDLVSPKVVINEGTHFNGSCRMIRSKEIVVDKNSQKLKVVDLSPEDILTSR